jgi:hypothetical protein
MLATFMILVRFLDSDCRNAIASPSALAGQAGFPGLRVLLAPPSPAARAPEQR